MQTTHSLFIFGGIKSPFEEWISVKKMAKPLLEFPGLEFLQQLFRFGDPILISRFPGRQIQKFIQVPFG